MKRFEIPMVVTSVLGLWFLADPQVPAARADFRFGPRVNLGPTVNSLQTDGNPVISPNGLELFFVSNRPGGYGGMGIWVSKRASVEDPWGPPENLGPGINNAGDIYPKSISSDELTLYLTNGSLKLYTATRPAIGAPWGSPVSLGPVVNCATYNCFPVISADDLELYFAPYGAGGLGGWDIYVSTRATRNDPWGPPVNLGPTINTAQGEITTAMSPDGLVLFIGSDRPGGFGGLDTWMTWRAYKGAPWSTPLNLGSSFNTAGDDALSSVSADGRWAYIYEQGPMGPYGDLWMAPTFPVLDFNGDGKVDEQDLLIMTQHWAQDYPLCDVGPFAWGDGVVDERDLSVLMKETTQTDFARTPAAHASEIPYETILSWTPVPFAASYDVYFGPSLVDVNSADRAHPKGVLVSQGQAATTWKPQSPLSFGQIYYWRVDFVGAGPASIIYRGCVLDFTTEPFALPIKGITATASSAQPDNGPEKTIDGSGLDQNDGHSTDTKDMWWSFPTTAHWIHYEFDKVYTLHEMWVWNFNMVIEPTMGFGAHTVKIEYSTDGTTWTALADVAEFAKAPGTLGYTAGTKVSFGGVSAKYVKLTIEKGWGTTPVVGLSEVRFFYIPDRPTAQP